jgi:hypothetical protein
MYTVNTKILTSKDLSEYIEFGCFRSNGKVLTNITLHADKDELTVMSLNADTLRLLQNTIGVMLEQDFIFKDHLKGEDK